MIDRDTLAKNYATKSDDELLELHASKTLTKLAYEVIELELKKRNLELPPPKREQEKVKREQKRIARKLLAEQYANKTDEEILTMLENRIKLSEMALDVLLDEGKKRGMLKDEYMPQWLKFFFGMGKFFFGIFGNDTSGDLEKNINDFTKAIQLDPDDAEAYFNRGSAYYDLGNLKQAIQDYERYLELAPNAPEREDLIDVIEELKLELK